MVNYDSSNLDSIVNFANKLKGKCLSDVTDLFSKESHKDYSKVKGRFGQVLQESYFGIPNDSESVPDFRGVGVELKSTPLKKLSSGKLTAKERLVLNIINYEKIIEEKWENSSFLTKNQLLLLIFYLYESNKSFLDFFIQYVKLWNIKENDLEIIQQDWKTIVKKIKDGKAHELSEGDTFYLSACRKGAGNGKDLRKQPNSKTLAPQRAFSFKVKYMNSIIGRIEDSESVIKNKSLLKKNSFEEIIYSKFNKYLNKTTDEIEKKLDINLMQESKSYYATLAREIMGVKKKRIEEFEKADVYMKIIRLKENGLPKEDMSFPKMIFKEIAVQKWEESDFYDKLNKKFFFVVYQIEGDKTYLKKVFFWNIPFEDLKETEKVWKITKRLLNSGIEIWEDNGKTKNNLPNKSDNRVSHVRPHAQNKKDVDILPDGRELTKQCFWLNASYLKEQIERNNS